MRTLSTPLTIFLAIGIGSCGFLFERDDQLNPGDVLGQVVADDGTPLPHSRILVDGTPRVVTANRDGIFLVSGLPPGTWILRVSHDFNGDGLPERAAVVPIQLRVSAGETAFLILGSVTAGAIAKASGVVQNDGGDPLVGADVFARRDSDLGDGLSAEGGVEQRTVSGADGSFRFSALAAGDLDFVAFAEIDGEVRASEPRAVTLAPGDDADLALQPLQVLLAGPLTRSVQLELEPPPDGEDVKVLLTRPGEAPDVNDLQDFDNGLVVPGGRSVSLGEIPIGLVDAHIITESGSRGLLCGKAPSPPGPLLSVWATVELQPDSPCVTLGDDDRDCDGDGVIGLPLADRQPVLATWQECAAACADAFGGAGANSTCTTSDGDVFDCDDDGDGQPDVTEPFVCTTVCAGHDSDGDAICASVDLLPNCASNDPADSSCFEDRGADFVRPLVLPEYGGPPIDVPDAGPVDAGPIDAGFDAGEPDAGPIDAGPGLPVTNAIIPRFTAATGWSDHLQVVAGQPTNAVCDPVATPNWSSCTHGAELVEFLVPELTDCDSVTAADALDAFDWECVEQTGVVIRSTGLKAGKGLSDLIDFGGRAFFTNKVIVSQGGVELVETPSTTWWDNAFVDANDGLLATETVADAIHLITAPTLGSRWVLDAPGASLVCEPGLVLPDPGGVPGGSLSTVDLTDDFQWLECDMDVNSFNNSMRITGDFATFRKSIVTGASGLGPILVDTRGTRMVDLHFEELNDWSIEASSGGNLIQRLTTVGLQSNGFISGRNNLVRDSHFTSDSSGSRALLISGANNVLQFLQVSNCQTNCLEVTGGRNVVQWSNFSNANAAGIQDSGSGSIYNQVTISGSGTGLFLQGGFAEVAGLLSIGNQIGVRLQGNAGGRFDDLASIGGLIDVQIAGTSSSNEFHGRLWVTGTQCTVTSTGGNPGLIDGTCTDDGAALSSTYTGQFSDAVLHPQAEALGALVGYVVPDDVNPQTNTEVASAIQDFLTFSEKNRSWAPSGVFPGAAGNCSGAESCSIFDANLALGHAGDPNALGLGGAGPVALGPRPFPLNNQSVFWGGFANDQAGCDLVQNGSQFNGKGCDSEFILDMVEVLFDGVGNENGLCESDETCVFSPNIGGYPGHGDLVLLQANFSAGTVANVELLGFANNGF